MRIVRQPDGSMPRCLRLQHFRVGCTYLSTQVQRRGQQGARSVAAETQLKAAKLICLDSFNVIRLLFAIGDNPPVKFEMHR